MAARLGGGADEPIVDINITPFVDIVLVLLIIFMVTATYIVAPSIKVDLPEAATGEATDSSSLGLTLTSEGGLYLDGQEIQPAELRRAIRREKARTSDVTALIAADRDVSHGRVVWLIDLVRQEGVAKFAINIDPAVVRQMEAAGAGGG